jgi:hypothetical protein
MKVWWRLWWGLAESAFVRSLESGSRSCVGVFDINLASVALKMFSHLTYFCTFTAIYKFNTAINCIRPTVHCKKVLFSSTLTGHTLCW